jgi:hypothetical protein
LIERLEIDKQRVVDEKTQVSCSGIESERRVYSLQKEVQELRHQVNLKD